MPEQKTTELFLKEVAAAIDSSAEELFGERIGFSLFVWPTDESEKANYISNCEKDEIINCLRHALMRFETDMVDPIDDDVNPTNN